MTEWEQTLALNKCLKELDALRQERDSLKIDLDQASLYLRSSELSERVLESERDSLKQKVWGLEQAVEIVRARSFEQQIEDLERQVKIAVEALKDEIQREAVHGNQAPHVTARHARLSRVMAEIEAAKGGSGER